MAIKSQETELYIINPTGNAVLKIGDVTDVDGIDASMSAVETTTLDSDHKTYIPGIAEPGSASFTINFDPKDASHATLHDLRNAGTQLHWALGFSDGTVSAAPDSGGSTDGFDQGPVARTFIYFDGFMTSYPFSGAVNGVVTSKVGVQLTNRPVLVEAESST